MIKVNELRLNNIVTVDNPEYHPRLKDVPLRVKEVICNHIDNEEEYVISLEHVSMIPNKLYSTYWQFIGFIKPIELTEDVLMKCGFRKHKLMGYDSNFTYSIFMGGEVINITAIYNADFSIMLHSVARKIKYLHELQNLYYAITKEELEVNL